MLDSLDLPAALPTADTHTVRRARHCDLDALIGLLSDDAISAGRGDAARGEDRPAYEKALARILSDPANELVVVEDAAGVVVGTLQLTLIPGMARRGATRLLVEAVRVSSERRSAGIGGALMRWVTDVAALSLGAALVQLTSDSARVDAHRFYERLGFVASHVGFKYAVPSV
ncbi:GNAT family N-acetyltransferase [Frondihabitans australicus]|uniref:Ribosomal protein S18 acetylase RimI-like enzyme n=1 Tax=Frondihabitans australicus TaxID=386892 RepID=A0A495IEX8_9MICO|nr:GNAT family N-acetyltransferase [Frondihabitans australicus]RKR74200.1 ribosomal protein S18 acetylase RimI-like enzyme [Frondihabitans australicus]